MISSVAFVLSSLRLPLTPLLRKCFILFPLALDYFTLDFAIAPRSWLPAILSSEAKPHVAFPSDHFLVETRIRIKLGAKHKRVLQPPKLDYSLMNAYPDFKAEYNN